MYQVDATARAPKGLTLNNPSQARKGAVWGQATRDPACVPEARALNPSVFEEFKSASLRDAVAHIWAYPTLRFERGCSLLKGVVPFGRAPALSWGCSLRSRPTLVRGY